MLYNLLINTSLPFQELFCLFYLPVCPQNLEGGTHKYLSDWINSKFNQSNSDQRIKRRACSLVRDIGVSLVTAANVFPPSLSKWGSQSWSYYCKQPWGKGWERWLMKIATSASLVSLGKLEAGRPCVTFINHSLHTTSTQETTFVCTSCLQCHDIWPKKSPGH